MNFNETDKLNKVNRLNEANNLNGTGKLEETIKAIRPLNQEAMKQSEARWNSIAKPLYAFGEFEPMTIRMAGITGDPEIRVDKKALVIMCGDHGVLEEGVSQSNQEITAVMTEGFTRMECSASVMAEMAGVDMFPVDIGVARDVIPEVINRKIAYGTKNMAKEPAMTREQAIRSIEVGIEMVEMLKEKGYEIICVGEMGVGNTTPSSAMASVFLDVPVAKVTGRGSGLKAEGLAHKTRVLERIMASYTFDKNDPLDVLTKVGGFEIGGMAGLYLGAAACRIPVVADGVISCVAALLACRLAPSARDYLFASHLSKEPAGKMLLDALELKPCLTCEMHLGEGTGAVALMPVLDLALGVYHRMSTFTDVDIMVYEPYDENDAASDENTGADPAENSEKYGTEKETVNQGAEEETGCLH